MNLIKKAILSVRAKVQNLDNSGQDMVEYALIVSLIGLGTVVGMKSLANIVNNELSVVGSLLVSNIGS